MSWENDQPNIIRDYLDCTELFTRELQLTPMPRPDEYHGRSRTELEQALDSAFLNAFNNQGLYKFKDPMQCPVDLLPALALEAGVNGWYQGVSVEAQRQTIANSNALHRKAGTLQGIATAISELGLDVAVTTSTIPFRLTILSNTALTPALTELVKDRVTRYKSERDEIYIERVITATAQRHYANPSFMTVGVHSHSKGSI